MNKHTPTLIFLILCLLILSILNIANWNCTSMPEYEFIDMYDKKHLYEEKIKGLNKTVTHYCQKHHEWEIINIRYTRDGIKYRVIMNAN